MSVYIFLGPSLPLEEARKILPAEYLPPAKAGDICALMRSRPRAIGLIDGLFAQAPSPWHKEILHALSEGVRVFGASSMGALRAAELHPFGMEGVGRIFEKFHSGEYEDDDEVALVHGPAELGYRPLSEAMVNLREGLRRALERGGISPETHAALLGAMKARFYPDRSWAALREAAEALGVPAAERRALDLVIEERPDQKRDDARLLLERLAAELAAGLPPHRPSFTLEETRPWLELVARTRQASRRAPLRARPRWLKGTSLPSPRSSRD